MPSKFDRPSEVLRLFKRISVIPGFFNYDDAQHFALVLNIQEVLGISGDILEIGTWKGRSATFLSFFLRGGETLILNDVFSVPAIDSYADYPSVADVRGSITKYNPDADTRILFLEGLSGEVEFPKTAKCKFVHVDGGHSIEECYSDLCKVGLLIVPGGVIVVDDYDHPDWPGVKPAVDRWHAENTQFSAVGDMNRHSAKGRKLYLMKRPF